MLARERAVEADHEIGELGGNRLHPLAQRGIIRVHQWIDVHERIARMAENGRHQPLPIHEGHH